MSRRPHASEVPWLTAFVVLTLAASAASQTIVLFEHSGSADPASEGWQLSAGPNVTFSPVLNDLDSGFDAWTIDDDGAATGDIGFYSRVPAAASLMQATRNGWRLSARLRVVDDTTSGGSPMVSVRDGGTAYQMHFAREPDGDPVVQLVTEPPDEVIVGPVHTLAGTAGGYHLYELVYDPLAGSADLLVDGVEVLADYSGFALEQSLVLFGAGSSPDTGQGNFNWVRFQFEASTVPIAPGASLLLGVALASLGILALTAHRIKGT